MGKRKYLNKVFAVFLSAIMLISAVSMPVFADEIELNESDEFDLAYGLSENESRQRNISTQAEIGTYDLNIEGDFEYDGDVLVRYTGPGGDVVVPDGTLSIKDRAFAGAGRESIKSITLPDGLESLGERAFYGCDSLTSITLPDGLESIGEGAFESCSSLTSITLPDGLESIGERTFYDCDSLTSITLPDGLESIGDSAFENSGLTSITLPDGLESIGDSAFSRCRSLTSIILPNGLESIGDSAFWDCWLLQSVKLPDSLESLGERAFGSCSSLTSINLPDGLKSIGDNTFISCRSLTSITLPDSLESLGERAFDSCSSLTSINLPDGLKSIGDYAFYSCSSLTSITLPDGLKSIGYRAFWGCSNLSLTSSDLPDSLESLGERAFGSCSSLTSITLPDGLKSIGEGTFNGCSNLTSITLPDGLETIGNNAFRNCWKLTSITLPDGLKSIGDRAFENSGLTSITLPDGLETIGEWAFYCCYSLTSVVMPSSVTKIGIRVFSSCSSLTSIMISSSVTEIDSSAFYDSNHVTFYGYQGSTAQQFANENGLAFEIINDEDDEDEEKPTFVDGQPFLNLEVLPLTYDTTDNVYQSDSFNLNIAFNSPTWIRDISPFPRPEPVENAVIEITLPEGLSFSKDASELTQKWTVDEEPIPILTFKSTNYTIYFSDPSKFQESYTITAKFTGSNYPEQTVVCKINSIEKDKQAPKDALQLFTNPPLLFHLEYIPENKEYVTDEFVVEVVINGPAYTELGAAYENPRVELTLPDGLSFDKNSKITTRTLEFAGPIIDSEIRNQKPTIYIRKNIFGNHEFKDYYEITATLLTDNLEPKSAKLTVWTKKQSPFVTEFTSRGQYLSEYRGTDSKVEIPEDLNLYGIRSGAFQNNDNIKSVTIPDGVKLIESKAFNNCKKLEEIHIPGSVTTIQKDAFFDCPNLTIYGKKNSAAQKYAEANNITFKMKDITSNDILASDKEINELKAEVKNIQIGIDSSLSEHLTPQQLNSLTKTLAIWIAFTVNADISAKAQNTSWNYNISGAEFLPGGRNVKTDFKLEIQTKNYGLRTFVFTYQGSVYSFEGNKPFASFGSISWKIENPTNVPQIHRQGSQMPITGYQMERLTNKLADIVDTAMKDVYNSTISGTIDELAGVFLSDTFNRILSDVIQKKPSELVYKLITEPGKNSNKKIGSVNCPVNVYILDQKGGIVGAIENNIVTVIPINDELSMSVIGDNKQFEIIGDIAVDTYTIRIVATDSGTMSYTITEYKDETVVQRVFFDNVPLIKGKMFEGNIALGEHQFKSDYKMHVTNNGESLPLLSPDYVFGEVSAIPYVSIDALSTSGGTITGNQGSYLLGDTVILQANSYFGYTFVGWYENGMKISEENSLYTFAASYNKMLQARFVNNSNNYIGNINDSSASYSDNYSTVGGGSIAQGVTANTKVDPLANLLTKVKTATEKAAKDTPAGQTVKAAVQIKNADKIKHALLKQAADTAKKAGGNVTLHFDTMSSDGKSVLARISVNPEFATKDLLLSANKNSNNIKALFEKWFVNKIRVVHLEQEGSFGMPIKIAAKVDLDGMDTKNLYFYSYNKKLNSYHRIGKPAYWLDKNGYLHFTTEMAGDIIIIDGELVRK